MRIIRFLLVSFFIIVVLGGGLALIGRELVLAWGVATVRSHMGQLRQIARNPQAYATQCAQKGALPSEQGSIIESLQMRFTSDTDFVLEVVCVQFRLDPIRVSQGSLPVFVQKDPGSSGLIWGSASSAVELGVFGRHRTVLVEDQQLFYEKPGIVNLGEGPMAACQSYGFECCQMDASQGMGDQLTQVTDCPRSCYSQCIRRPVVLSFTSDPFLNPQTRVATVGAGEVVTFSYVVDIPEIDLSQVVIDFGDGQEQELPETTGSTTHVYECAQTVCSYEATLQVTQDNGVTAAQTPVTKITLQVAPIAR